MLWGSAAVKGHPGERRYTEAILSYTKGRPAVYVTSCNGKVVATYPVTQTLPLGPDAARPAGDTLGLLVWRPGREPVGCPDSPAPGGEVPVTEAAERHQMWRAAIIALTGVSATRSGDRMCRSERPSRSC
jgi:hypothetical protein